MDTSASVRIPEGGWILEIGAGTGQLTEHLLLRGAPVLALEVEDRLVAHLRKRFAGESGLRVIQDDARTADVGRIIPPNQPYTLAGNLPYFAASPIIRHFLEARHQPTELIVMVQREVARRILSKPGHLSLLAVSVQVYAEPEHLFDVPPEAFDPPPQVWSSVIRLTVRKEPLIERERLIPFFDLVSSSFLHSRKQLRNARWPGFGRDATLTVLENAGIDPARRPETLAIEEWEALLDACEELNRAG